MMDDLRQKFDKVEQYVSSLAKNLAGNNKELETKLKEKIRNKVLQKETKSRKDDTTEFVEILKDKELEPDTETIVKAKETSLGIDEWTKNNIKTVRDVEGEVFKQTLVETTKTNNPNITEDQVKSVGELADLVNKIYNGDGGIENQKDVVFEQNKNESTEEVKHVWMDLRGRVGLLRQSPQELIKTEDDYQKTNNKLQGVSLPYQKMDKLASFDRIMNPSDNSEIRRLIDSARNKYKTITSYVFNKPVVKTEQGFASTINGQSASVFVKKSMDTLLHPGFVGGQTTLSSGLSSGVSSGFQNLVSSGASFLKKSTGNVANKLGIGAKKVLGNGFNKIGGALVKGLNVAVSSTTKLVGSLGIKTVAPFIIGFFLLFFLLSTLQTNSLMSSIVNVPEKTNNIEKENENQPNQTGSDGLTYSEPMKCDHINKTVATSQCSGANSSTYLNKERCPKTDRGTYSRTICSSGCGLISTAIILQAHDPIYTPVYTLKNTGFASRDICRGIGWSMIKDTINEVLGADTVEGKAVGCNEEFIKEKLCSGYVVIINFQHEPSGGHFIVAVGVTESGEILLKDSKLKTASSYMKSVANDGTHTGTRINACLLVKADNILK